MKRRVAWLVIQQGLLRCKLLCIQAFLCDKFIDIHYRCAGKRIFNLIFFEHFETGATRYYYIFNVHVAGCVRYSVENHPVFIAFHIRLVDSSVREKRVSAAEKFRRNDDPYARIVQKRQRGDAYIRKHPLRTASGK